MPSTQALERALRTYGTAREQVRGDGITNGATALATALGVPLEPDKVRALSDIIGTSHILPGDSLLNAALNLRGNENIRRFRHRHGLDLDREQYPLYMEISLWGTEGKKNEPQIVRIFTQNYQTGTQFETFYLREETESEAGDRSVTYKRYDATLEDINHDLVHQDVEGLKVNPFSTFSVQFNIPLPQEQSSISISEPAQSTTTAESVNDSTEAAELVQAMEQALGLEQSTSQPSTRVMEQDRKSVV